MTGIRKGARFACTDARVRRRADLCEHTRTRVYTRVATYARVRLSMYFVRDRAPRAN